MGVLCTCICHSRDMARVEVVAVRAVAVGGAIHFIKLLKYGVAHSGDCGG